MSDLNPDDLAKVGGGGAGIGALLMFAFNRIFGSQDKVLDKVLARLDVLQAAATSTSEKLAVLLATSEHRDADVDTLKSQYAELGRIQSEHSKAIARMEALMSKLSEGN